VVGLPAVLPLQPDFSGLRGFQGVTISTDSFSWQALLVCIWEGMPPPLCGHFATSQLLCSITADFAVDPGPFSQPHIPQKFFRRKIAVIAPNMQSVAPKAGLSQLAKFEIPNLEVQDAKGWDFKP